MKLPLRCLAPMLVAALAACSSSPDASDASGTGSTPPVEAAADPDDPGERPRAPSPPAVCVAPAAPTATKVTVAKEPGRAEVALPVEISGTSERGIDFVYFDFVLTDVARLVVHGEVKDFDDPTEKTGTGVEIRSTITDINTSVATLHMDPSTTSDDATSGWLYPGAYEIIFKRATYASANTTKPTLPHAYELSIALEHPPVAVNGCTMPAGVTTKTDVRWKEACNAWCKKLPACGIVCRDECDIPEGQCAESVEKRLACMNAASFECVTRPGATGGYSIDAICKLDSSVCGGGT